MLHPNAQVGRNIFDIDECFEAVIDLLLREYNKDFNIRSPFFANIEGSIQEHRAGYYAAEYPS